VCVVCAGGCGIVDPHSVEEALQRGGQVPQHAGQSITSTLRASAPQGLANRRTHTHRHTDTHTLTHTHTHTHTHSRAAPALCHPLCIVSHTLRHSQTDIYLKTTSYEMCTHARNTCMLVHIQYYRYQHTWSYLHCFSPRIPTSPAQMV